MRLRTLGGLELEGTSLNRPQPLLLLTYLALEGPKDRRHLAELFWSGAANPLNSLSSALSRLRKSATGVVEADNVRVRTHVHTDAAEVLKALEKGDLETALKHYQGRFLDGFYLQDWSTELEEWVYGTREFLAARVREGLLRLAEDEAACGHYEAAARQAEKAYLLAGAPELEPNDFERLYTLMVAGKSSRAAEIRKEAEEFDIDLQVTSKQAKVHFFRGSNTQKQATSHVLPIRGTSFVGRDREVHEVIQLLHKYRLVSLTGMGGIGKSRLALQVAYALSREDAFKDGVVFVPLEALSSPALVPSAIAKALGITFLGSEELLSQVIQQLADRHILLIVDNFEQLLSGALILNELLTLCPNLKLLVTSRERLNLEEEVAYPVTKLPLPDEGAVTPEQALTNPAVRLFVERAKRANLRFILNEQTRPAVLTLCRLVDGSPLGLELAATWVRIMSPADIAVEIEKSLDFLTTPTRNTTKRHYSLRAVFEHSWHLLMKKEQEALRKLSIFEGGFRREAAAEVAGATIPLLASLVDKSLLRWMPNGRYDRHPLIYQFTQEKLSEFPEEQSKTQEKHGAYYFRFLEQRVETMWGPKQRELLAAIDEELGNIRAAWTWSVSQGRLSELMTASLPLQRFFDRRNRPREGIDLFAQAIQALDNRKPDHRSALGTLLVDQAWFYFRVGKLGHAIALTEKGLELLHASLRPFNHTGLNTIGVVAMTTGDFTRARGFLVKALAIAKKQGERQPMSSYLENLGILEVKLGNKSKALHYFQESLQIKREMNNFYGEVNSLNNLGVLAFEESELEKSKTLLEEGYELAKRQGFEKQVPYLLGSLAEVYFDLGNYDDAYVLCKKVLATTEESTHWEERTSALTTLGRLSAVVGNFDESQAYLKKALNIRWSAEAIPSVLASLIFFAELKISLEQPEQAYGWLMLVTDHPATEHWRKKRATQILTEMEAQLPDESTKEAGRLIKALELNKVVEAILDEA